MPFNNEFTSFSSFPFTGNSHCISAVLLTIENFNHHYLFVMLFQLCSFISCFLLCFEFYFRVSLSVLQICICNDKDHLHETQSIGKSISIFFPLSSKRRSHSIYNLNHKTHFRLAACNSREKESAQFMVYIYRGNSKM